jgi:hypothetical protein
VIAAFLPALEPKCNAFGSGRAHRSRLHRDILPNSMAGFSRGLRYMARENYYAPIIEPPASSCSRA